MAITKSIKPISAVLAFLLMFVMTAQPALAADRFSSRSAVPAQYKWDLTRIYETMGDWESDALLLEATLIPRINSYRDRLDRRENVLTCFKALTEAHIVLEKLLAYAAFGHYVDMSIPGAQALYGRVAILGQKLGEAASYIGPQLAIMGTAVLTEYLGDPDFREYTNLISGILNRLPNILSEEEEALLAMQTIFAQSPLGIYSMLYNVDMYSVYNAVISIVSPDNRAAAEAAGIRLNLLRNLNNTFAAILAAEVNKNIFWARARNFNSTLEASLSPDIPVIVYENLISATNRGLASKHRYNNLVMEMANTQEFKGLYPYISYEEARKTILSALKALGADYVNMLETVFNENWIDVYPTPNKMGGAFSASLYSVHPFVLMNYYGTIYCAATLAHELGHAIHKYYSSATQPFNAAGVPIFTAEVAALVNEIIL